MLTQPMCAMSARRRLVLALVALCLAAWCEITHQNPVQQQQTKVANVSRPARFNQTCITENLENGTLIISSSMVTSTNADPNQQTPTAQFNERRRDMYFEDYNIKQIEVVDTSVITNRNSSNGGSQTVRLLPSSPSSSSSSNSKPPIQGSPSVPTSSSPAPSNGDPSNPAHYLPIQPQRPNVLAPKMDPSGRPACVQSPDDTFCEVVDNYPNKTLIRNEIDLSQEQFNDIFGSKEIDGRKSYVDPEDGDESVCRKVPRVIYPQMAKNQANQWIYVVNEVEYTQAVVAEICEKPGKPCAHLENMPMGMYSICKQKYSYKRLLALHPTEKRTYPDAFKFPSCCSCYIKYSDEYLGRSNSRKLDAKVGVSEVQGRDSRAMSTNSNGTSAVVIDTQINPNDNSTIEIMSQPVVIEVANGNGNNSTHTNGNVAVANVQPSTS